MQVKLWRCDDRFMLLPGQHKMEAVRQGGVNRLCHCLLERSALRTQKKEGRYIHASEAAWERTCNP